MIWSLFYLAILIKIVSTLELAFFKAIGELLTQP